MQSESLVPTSFSCAEERINAATLAALQDLNNEDLIKAWFAISYAFPGLHPDDFDSPDGSWPENLQSLAQEVWIRAESGLLTDVYLYPADAQWSGIYDRMNNPTIEEQKRRREIHVQFLLEK